MDGNDFIIYGGVRFDKSEVWQKFESCDVEGKKHYVVDFKNGTRIAFTGGQKGAYATALQLGDEKKGDHQINSTNVYGVMGLELQATNQADAINVANSTIIGIDISGDGAKDLINIQKSKGERGARALFRENYHYGDGMVEADYGDDVRIDAQSKLPPVKRTK